MDVWSGETLGKDVMDYITVEVASHDTALLRVYPNDFFLESLTPSQLTEESEQKAQQAMLHVTGASAIDSVIHISGAAGN